MSYFTQFNNDQYLSGKNLTWLFDSVDKLYMVSYVGIGLENCEILYRCEMLLLICITYGKSAVLVALVSLSCRLPVKIIKGMTTCAIKFSVISNSRPGLNLKTHLDEQSEVNPLISDSSEKWESFYLIVLLRKSKDCFVVTRYKG